MWLPIQSIADYAQVYITNYHTLPELSETSDGATIENARQLQSSAFVSAPSHTNSLRKRQSDEAVENTTILGRRKKLSKI